MTEGHNVIIVGAGVVGCAIAYNLAALGERDVLLLEREALPGSGSTAKANGGIRAQFTTPVNIAMSLAAMALLDELAPAIGEPPVYRKAGYLFLTGDERRLAAMAEAVAFQRARGVAVDLLDAAGVARLAPYVAGERLLGGTFGPRDGFIDPGGLANWFLSRSLAAGARIRYRSEVLGIEPAAGGAWRLDTGTGSVTAPTVVNAAGPWARRLAAMVGVDLPVDPVRRHILVSGPCAMLPREIPMTIDADTGVLIRREGDRVLIAHSPPDEPPGFDTTYDPAFVERIAEPLIERFPAVADAGIDHRRSWAGLYEVSPDHHAILGAVAGAPGFILANGFSGHGVMHSPATGRCIAELIVRGRATTVDIAPLALDRFARGAAIHETMVL
jgi:sarcosine oxidase, subunit beta